MVVRIPKSKSTSCHHTLSQAIRVKYSSSHHWSSLLDGIHVSSNTTLIAGMKRQVQRLPDSVFFFMEPAVLVLHPTCKYNLIGPRVPTKHGHLDTLCTVP